MCVLDTHKSICVNSRICRNGRKALIYEVRRDSASQEVQTEGQPTNAELGRVYANGDLDCAFWMGL